jgi:hypothetical protein
MKRIIFPILLLAAVTAGPALVLSPWLAFASEKPLLGALYATNADAGVALDTTNSTTQVPFTVPHSARISIQCDKAVYFISDDETAVTSSRGIKIAADQFFMTKVETMPSVRVPSPDGGTSVATQRSAVVRIVGITAGESPTCRVWARDGDE